MESLLLKLGYDVRQTLHHITGLLELIGEEPLSRNQSHYLSRCRASADQLLRATNDLSFLTSEEPSPGEVSIVSIRDRVAEIAELMHVLAERKGVELTWTIESSAPELVAVDSELMQDSLRRVLDNAIRFTAKGTVQLSVRVVPQAGERALLDFAICDTGPGIPADVREDFESATALPRSGGLGLTVVRKRIAAAGGSLSIVSSGAEGTTVRLSLPARIPQASSDHAPPSDARFATAELSSMRLLVAEDSDDSFLLLKAYLRETGHQVSRAVDGAQAVAMAQAGEYDLVMMDANMPVMDGYQATRSIRDWETERGRGRIPILLISADERARQLRLGATAGCSGYLAKPTTKAQVLEALQYFTAGDGTLRAGRTEDHA